MNFFYILLIAGGCAFTSNAQSDDTITAAQGESLVLNFNYCGYRVDYKYTKDGNNFVPDGRRTFTQFGRILFSRMLPSDSGTYRLRVGQFDKTITVTGKYS